MQKKTKIIILTIILLLLINITTIAATDDTNTTTKTIKTTTQKEIKNTDHITTENNKIINKTQKQRIYKKTYPEVNINNYTELKNALANNPNDKLSLNIQKDIKLENTLNISPNIKTVTINGNEKTIDGNQYNFLKIDTINLTLKNITIINCKNTNGGAIDAYNSNITINHGKFINNTATRNGGAIYAPYSHINIINSNFTENTAATGGAIDSWNSLYINNSFFTKNKANFGGAIHSDSVPRIGISNRNIPIKSETNTKPTNNDKIKIEESTFTYNEATQYGGAIHSFGMGNITILKSKLSYNKATRYGGAISGGIWPYINIISSNITHNHAEDGGAIEGVLSEEINIINSNIAYNTATNNGGAIHGWNIRINNSKLNNNNATQYGGAIIGAKIQIDNSNLTENTAKNGGTISTYNDSTITNISVRNSNLTNNHAEYGGVIYTRNRGELNIISSIFTNNSATYNCGVILSETNTTNIINSSFIRNWVSAYGSEAVAYIGGNLKMYNSILQENYAPVILAVPANFMPYSIVTGDLSQYSIIDNCTLYDDSGLNVHNANISNSRIITTNKTKDRFFSSDNKLTNVTITNTEIKDTEITLLSKTIITNASVNNSTIQLFRENNLEINKTRFYSTDIISEIIGYSLASPRHCISNVTIDNSNFTNKNKEHSTLNLSGNLKINNSTFSNNYIIKQNGNLTITYSNIKNNIVQNQPIISSKIFEQYIREKNNNTENNLQISNCNFTDNAVLTDKYIIDFEKSSNITITYNHFNNNTDNKQDMLLCDANKNMTINIHDNNYTNNYLETKITTKITEKNANQTTYKINIKLRDIYNDTIKNGKINIYTNNILTDTLNINNNTLYYTLKNLTKKQNNITLKYISQNKNYQNTSTQIPNKTNIKLNPINGIIGEKITLTAYLTDENENPITGGNLAFKLNGKTLRNDGRFDSTAPAMKFNVKNGKVTYTINADLYLRNAKNLTATYSGNHIYEETRSETVEAQIQKRYAEVTLTVTPTKAKQYDTIKFTATIRDTTKNSKNTTLINQNTKVMFKVNEKILRDKNKQIIYVPVNANKQATYDYTIPAGTGGITTNKQVKDYKVEAILVGDNYYPGARNNSKFNIERSTTTVTITQAKVTTGNILSIKATLKDFKGNNLIGTNKYTIKVNGKSYIDPKNSKPKYWSVKNGEIDLTGITVDPKTTIKRIMIVTGERQAYLEGRNETTKIIEAQ